MVIFISDSEKVWAHSADIKREQCVKSPQNYYFCFYLFIYLIFYLFIFEVIPVKEFNVLSGKSCAPIVRSVHILN